MLSAIVLFWNKSPLYSNVNNGWTIRRTIDSQTIESLLVEQAIVHIQNKKTIIRDRTKGCTYMAYSLKWLSESGYTVSKINLI